MDAPCTPGYPVGKRLSAKCDGTFGALTLKERLPKVLTQIIDTIHQYQTTAKENNGQAGTDAVKSVMSGLTELRYRMQTNKSMLPITTGDDVGPWGEAMDAYREELQGEPVWYGVSWLFFECYMYRKVMEIIRNEPLMSEYDPFNIQKESSFTESIEQIKSVAKQLVNFIEKPSLNEGGFQKFLLLSLWGNKMDLSMAVTMESYDMTQQANNEDLNQYILSDHSTLVWHLISSPSNRQISIILDNSGFELFSDLCLAEWLLASGVADKVILHCKQLPWFISDATYRDISWTIRQLNGSNDECLSYLGNHWDQRLANGSLVIQEHSFWTTSYEYSSMNRIAPDLYTSLSHTFLAIFKGDLNYRKLISDRNWPYTQPFHACLQEFRPTNVLALRTMKADLVCGLPEGAAQRAAMVTSDWMIKGLFAVIQLAKTTDH
jgi:hypothetical protein